MIFARKEGPECGKMETEICQEPGFAYFLHWENGIWVTGTGNHKSKIVNGKHVYTLHSICS